MYTTNCKSTAATNKYYNYDYLLLLLLDGFGSLSIV